VTTREGLSSPVRTGILVRSILPFLLLAAWPLGGCEGPPREPERPVAVGEASSGPDRDGFLRVDWSISDEPRIVLGTGAVAEDPPLHRIHGAFRREDGGITLAQGSQVHLYDDRGRLIRRASGEGEGPGEVLAPTRFVRMAGDSSFFWDDRLGPAQVFGPLGDHVRTFRVPVTLLAGIREGASPRCVAGSPMPLPDLTLVQAVAACGTPWDQGVPEGVPYRPEFDVVLGRPEGDVALAGLALHGERRMWQVVDGEPISSHVGSTISVPHSPSWVIGGTAHAEALVAAGPPTAGGTRYFVADGWEAEVHEWSPEGIRAIPLRGFPDPRVVDPADWRREVDSLRPPEPVAGSVLPPGILDLHERRSRVIRAMPPPDLVRRFGWMLLDAAGMLWLHDREVGFMVVDPEEGRYLGRIELPASLANALLLEVGQDYILARVQGPDGEELVVLHGLVRGS
jgi:hypothetical protein